MRSRDALDDFLARARGEAEANRIWSLRAIRCAPWAHSNPARTSARAARSRRTASAPLASPDIRRAIRSLVRAGDDCAHGEAGLGAKVGRSRRSHFSILLRKRSNSRVAEGARGARSRHSRSYRSGRSGFAHDPSQVRFALRRRKLAAVGARPHRSLRPSVDGGRTRDVLRGLWESFSIAKRRSPDFTSFRLAASARPAGGCMSSTAGNGLGQSGTPCHRLEWRQMATRGLVSRAK